MQSGFTNSSQNVATTTNTSSVSSSTTIQPTLPLQTPYDVSSTSSVTIMQAKTPSLFMSASSRVDQRILPTMMKIRAKVTGEGEISEEDLAEERQLLESTHRQCLTSQTCDEIFNDRIAAINPLCEVVSHDFYIKLPKRISVALLRSLHACLDNYIYFQYKKAQEGAEPDETRKILEAKRQEYITTLEEKVAPFYESNVVSTDSIYHISCIVAALKAINTEKGFWGQVLTNLKSASGSNVAILLGVALKAIAAAPDTWYTHVWTIRNLTHLLLGKPNEHEFEQFIAYLRFVLETNTSHWKSAWQVGYAIGDALTTIAKHCPSEHLCSLTFYNPRYRQNLIPAYDEKNETKLAAESGTETKADQPTPTTVTTTTNVSQETTTAIATTEEKTAETTVTSIEAKAEAKTEKLQAITLPFYIDLEYLLSECQKPQSERYSVFYDDRALYSTIRGLIEMAISANPDSIRFHQANQYLNHLFTRANDNTSRFRHVINLIKQTDDPFLGKFLARYQEEKSHATDQKAQATRLTFQEAAPLSLPFDVSIELKPIHSHSDIGERLNSAIEYYAQKNLAAFAQEIEDLIVLSKAHAFSAEENSRFYPALHVLARIYLASGNMTEARELYHITVDDNLVLETNFYQAAGDSYLLKAIANNESYFSQDFYEQALHYFLKAKTLSSATTSLTQRIDYLKLRVDYWHSYQNLEQELLYYHTNPQLTVPIITIVQRLKPLATRLLASKCEKEVTALYQLLTPTIKDWVSVRRQQGQRNNLTTQDHQAIALLAQQLWTHRQYDLAASVYGIALNRYATLQSACRKHQSCPLDTEFKITTINHQPNWSVLNNSFELSSAVQQIMSNVCQEVAAQLGNPWGYQFDILAYGALSQEVLEPKGTINLAVLVAKETRYTNYFRDFLALIKVRLQQAFYPIFSLEHLQLSPLLELIQTPAALVDYCYAAENNQPKLLTDTTAIRYQLLRPCVVYSNNNNAGYQSYRAAINQKTALNQKLAIELLRVHQQSHSKLAAVSHFCLDLALYYGINETSVLKIIAALREKHLFVSEFIDQLEQEMKDVLMGRGDGYLIAALPAIASVWLQDQLPKQPFDPLLIAWAINHKNLAIDEPLIIALARYLIKNQQCLDVAKHLDYFAQVPSPLKAKYYRYLELEISQTTFTKPNRKIAQDILTILSEQPNATGERMATTIRQQQFLQKLHDQLTMPFTAEQKDSQAYVLLEWMNNTKKMQRRLKPNIIAQILTRDYQPNAHNRTKVGKRIVILAKDEQNRELAYFKFYPERPGVQFQVDALARRIVGYALQWKLCRLVIVQGNKSIAYPVMVSEPAGDSLLDVCNKSASIRFTKLCEKLDPRTYSLLMLSRIIIDPEDDQLANFAVQPCLDHNRDPAYRLICVDGDHAFDEPIVTVGKVSKVNLKSYLFCMDEMQKFVDARAREEFCHLKVYSLLQAWLKEVHEYDQLHVARRGTGLFSLDEVTRYLNAKELQESKNDQDVTSSYIPSIFIDKLVQNLFQRLIILQEILRTIPQITHIDLLQKINRNLAVYYATVLQLRKTPWERFQQLPHNYNTQKLLAAIEKVMPESSSRRNAQLLLGYISSSIMPNPNAQVSIEETLNVFKQDHYFQGLEKRINAELTKIYTLYEGDDAKKAILAGDADSLKKYGASATEHLINSIDFSRMSEEAARAILEAIVGVEFAILKLANCPWLDDQLLSKILKASQPTLLNLNVSNCPKLTAESIANIAACHSLRKLNVSGTKITFIGEQYFFGGIQPVIFPKLEELVAENCRSLATIRMSAPNLKSCRLEGAANLTTLTLENTTVLRLLDLKNSTKILYREFFIKYPFLAVFNLNNFSAPFVKTLDEKLTEIHDTLGVDWQNYSDEALKNVSSLLSDYLAETEEILQNLLELDLDQSAIAGLGNLGRVDIAVLKTLTRALGDKKSDVQSGAADALVKLALGTHEVIATLVKALGDKNVYVRSRVAEALGKLSKSTPEVIVSLIKALRDEDISVQSNATTTLVKLGQEKPEVIVSLIKALGDKERFVRSNVAEVLGKIGQGTPEVMAALVKALEDKDSYMQIRAAEALVKLGKSTPEVIAALLKALRSYESNFFYDTYVRVKAVEALGRLRHETLEVITALVKGLEEDKDGYVRVKAAEALVKLGKSTPEVIAALLKVIRDRASYHEGSMAAKVLGKIGQGTPEVMAALVKVLGDEESIVRIRAAEALGKIGQGTPEVIVSLIKALGDKERFVRSSVAEALGKIGQGTPEVMAALVKKVLGDEESFVRSAAAEALGKIGQGTPDIIIALLKALGDEVRGVRSDAARSLGKLGRGSAEVITALVKVLGDKEDSVRSSVAEALGNLGQGTPEVMAALVKKVLGDEESFVRSMATEALVKLGQTNLQAFKKIRLLFNKRDKNFKECFSQFVPSCGVYLKRFAVEVLAKIQPLVKVPEFITKANEFAYKEEIKAITFFKEEQAALITSYLLENTEPTAASQTQPATSTLPTTVSANSKSSVPSISPSKVQHLGWNCFDVAIGLTDLLVESKETKRSLTAEEARKAVVDLAVAKSSDITFRKLLAPEIRHAAAITALYLNKQAEAKESKQSANQVNQQHFCELFNVAQALQGDAEQEVVIAKMLQELNKAYSQESGAVQDLSLNALPKAMHTGIQKLVNDYYAANQELDRALKKWNAELKPSQGDIFTFDQWQSFFSRAENQREYGEIFAEFKVQEKLYLQAEKALQDYCESKDTYETYLREYYGKNKWYAFERSFSGEKATSMVDVTANLLGCSIVIRDRDENIIYQTGNTHIPKGTKEITYNGINHFTVYQKPTISQTIPANAKTAEITLACSSTSSSSSSVYSGSATVTYSASLSSFFSHSVLALFSSNTSLSSTIAANSKDAHLNQY